MSREARHDILFEPVEIGPVTARNRFFQVPHCNGMGHRDPTPLAFMRGVKAEGGWAVVCTEEVEIHPSSEVAPYAEGRLWDDEDIPALARMVEKVHEHGSLAGIELVPQRPRQLQPLQQADVDDRRTTCRRTATSPFSRGGWTSRTSPTSGAGTAQRCDARCRPASTSSTSTPATT